MDESVSQTNNKSPAKACCHNISDTDKLHVLVLHGYRQNGKLFCERTAAFRRIVHKWAKFTYITAPHKVVVLDDLKDADKINESEVETGMTNYCSCKEWITLVICRAIWVVF